MIANDTENGENGFGDDSRMPLVRVHLFKDDGGIHTNALQSVDQDTQAWNEAGAIQPPYDPRQLVLLMEHSNSLRQNIDAYATNIDGFGHSFTPIVDLEADDTIDRVRSVMMVAVQAGDSAVQVPEPTEAGVKTHIKLLANEQRMELLKLESFFEYCSDSSFPSLRRKTRQDIESTGNGYWEVLRNAGGTVAQFNYVESWTIRLMPLDTVFTEVTTQKRTAALSFEPMKSQKRFRRYVQRIGTKFVYFKEFSDPRVISSATGTAYADLAAMQRIEKDRDGKSPKPATEIIHFKVHSSRTAYGVPRWIGNLLSVLGSRQCEEVNFAYFENKSIPPLAVLVSGGRLAKEAVARLQDYVKNEIRGKDNFHKILVIEAAGPENSSQFENSGQTKIELKPLVEAQTSDALFQNYDERNIDKVGMAFRLPRMLRGDTRDFNRSCYSEDTETLTENGWKLWHEICDGELIAAYDNNDMGEIEFVPWHKLHVYDVVNEPMIHIHNVCTDILVTRDHTLLVRPDDADRAVIIKSQDIPTDAFWVGTLSEGDTPFDIDLDGECRVDPELDVSVVENYSGTVFCFSVPSHGFFVTRRNGKIAVQGNTSYAALDFAERQVFEPERQDFDYWVNRYVLPPLGIKHWRLKSNGPMLRDPEALSKMIHDLGDVLTPNTALELAQDVFGRRFGRIDAEWGDKPLKLTVAEIATRNNRAGGPAGDGEDTVAEDADPDNQAPNNEATQTNAKSDNKGEKGKTADQPRHGGQFGTKAPKKAPKAPSKPKRPTVKKTAEDAAEALVSIADTLEDIRVEEVLDRIARKRKP